MENALIKIRVFGALLMVFVLAACGGSQSQGGAQSEGAAGSTPSESAAQDGNVVEVTAVDGGGKYDFGFDQPVPAGATTFQLRNEGREPHFAFVVKLKEAGTLDDALKAEQGGQDPEKFVEKEIGEAKTVPPNSDKTSELTADLTPGPYAMLCFIGDKKGVPHAAQGMAVEFEVQ